MGNNDIKVKDLSTTSSLSTDNKLMLLTDEANNTVQNITVENALANIISSNANNSLSVGSDKKLYSADISSEVGDLDNLITTNKTHIVSAINEVKGDTNAITGEVVSASKGWLEEGKIYQKAYWYGEKIYNDVYTYNHSTFDLSKFTKVNNPIITDDGIVSNLTTANLVYIPCSSYNLTDATSFIIETEINLTTLSVGQRAFAYGSGNLIQIGTDGKIVFYATSNQATSGSAYDIANNIKSTNVLTADNKYKIAWEFNGTQHLIKVNGETWITVSNSNSVYDYSQATGISANCTWFSGHNFAPMLGSQDLKTCKIYKNGMLIFSGNKTGIDTIKPADYTIVGTVLTITDEGIASGFSASDYITKTTAITLDKTTYFEFDVTFTTPSSWTKNGRFWAYGNKQNFGHTSGGVISGGFIGTSINQTGLSALATNTKYNAKYIYDENGFYVAYKKANETTWTSSTPSAVTSNDTQTLQGAIGNAFTDTSAYYTGSIDLNSIKFYVNGNLVYQACLLIPYTESLTGSKIVDVAYRDRVIDVYNQFGFANYYTIDETNQNATLPMGEIYGFIEKTKENFSVPAYGNQNIGVTITDNLTYTCPDDGFIYCDNIQVTAGGGFDLSISRNGQSSSLISFGGISVDASVQIPFIYPVEKGDVVQILWSSTASTYPILYFVSKEGV